MTRSDSAVMDTPTPAAAGTTRPDVRDARPALDVLETAEEFLLRVDVPGAGKDDGEIGFEKGLLTIRARVPAREPAGERYHLREHARTGFARGVRLGDTIDAGRISAEVARGVLTLHLPKAEAAKPRRIEVR